MALIRYAGSKERLSKKIMSFFPNNMYLPLWMDSNRTEYREPFFGAGAIGIKILERLPPNCSAWINDVDYTLVCLWQSVWKDPKRLSEKVDSHIPNTDDHYRFKEEDGRRDLDPLELGFRKLVLHMTSYSGLGFKSGGPLGGRNQDNNLYPIDCRWNTESLLSDIARINKIFSAIPNLKITCRDFSELIDDNKQAFLYLDPPYYEKGEELYKHNLTEADHSKLANLLKDRNNWALSYDNHPQIWNMYKKWCTITTIKTVYTLNISKSKTRKNQEVLITPK